MLKERFCRNFFLIPCRYNIKMCLASKSNRNAKKMHFILNIQWEKESRMTSRSRSEDISFGRHALPSKPRLTPRFCQSMSPSTDIFRSGTRGHSWFWYSLSIALCLTRWRGLHDTLSKTLQRGKDPRFVHLMVSRNSYSPWTLARIQSARGTAYSCG